MLNRREFLATTAAVGLAAAFPFAGAFAQDAPQLKLFVPAAPGGGWDQTARTMDQVLRAEKLISGAQVTNVPGAGGTVGLPQFINQWKGQPNALMVGGMVMVGAIIANKAANNLTEVTPIARLTGEFEALVVPAASPFQTAQDFVAALKADPTKVPVAGGSAGGSDHILFGLIAKTVGVPATSLSYVPFAGGGEALAALLGNQVAAGISGYGEFAEQVKAGTLQAARHLRRQEAGRHRRADDEGSRHRRRAVQLARRVRAARRFRRGQGGDGRAGRQDGGTAPPGQTELKNRNWTPILLTGDDFAKFLTEDTARIEAILKDLGLA